MALSLVVSRIGSGFSLHGAGSAKLRAFNRLLSVRGKFLLPRIHLASKISLLLYDLALIPSCGWMVACIDDTGNSLRA